MESCGAQFQLTMHDSFRRKHVWPNWFQWETFMQMLTFGIAADETDSVFMGHSQQ